MPGWNHFDGQGNARMVDVSVKAVTCREAEASGTITMSRDALEQILQKKIKKGDVLTVAQVAGIMAAKRTWELIPMAHPLPLSGIALTFSVDEEHCTIAARCTAKIEGKTGVEMEALTGVSVALLTIYDMAKGIDRVMVLGQIRLEHKEGGQSGSYDREP